MAFLSSIQGKLQGLKEQASTLAEGAPGITAHLQSIKDGAPRIIQSARNAKSEILNKVGLDSLNKMMSTVGGGQKQSPIDIVPLITSFGEHLVDNTFRVEYEKSGEFKAVNTGNGLWLRREGNESELAISFLPEEQYHLDAINWHWGTEPMNGSEHSIGGVGYAAEVHLYHRSTRFANMETALKQPNGVVAISLFLNESHDVNESLTPFINLLPNVTFKGNEVRVNQYDANVLFPSPEKTKEFWVYEGSETVEPFREGVTWIVFRSALPISSAQLERLRTVKSNGYDEEHERPMNPLRPIQTLNSRNVVCSFRSGANAPNLGFGQ
ncbi:cah-6 [Pristionchus pacificus]|uniref:Cah-6 n=1 Tax=Pristionchus pacificus TaxID=54126 RepID=A0A2A6BW22_PRIPA|nr:cah-6 [Pristionchus pacificus]|eukprot:PDM70099.1 cah-6 [Pristionchus pacificus]